MNIGIIGSGSVGYALATGFSEAGYDVLLGSRDTAKSGLAKWAAVDSDHRSIGTYADAAGFGEMVILAVPGRTLGNMLDLAGRDSFSSAIVIDATNPIAYEGDEVVNAYGEDDSGAEFLQRELPGVPVVKAFNRTSPPAMTHAMESVNHVMRIAGDDADAKRRVAGVLEGFGWQVEDLGPISEARTLEHGVINWMKRSRA